MEKIINSGYAELCSLVLRKGFLKFEYESDQEGKKDAYFSENRRSSSIEMINSGNYN